jgi:glycyl-tRNA synthetase
MDMDKLVSLCKRRGFLFQSSEIYGGLNGFWDYGPLGVELKRNIKEAWWRDMITGHDDLDAPAGAPEAFQMVGLDSTIIMHPQVWKCSGHYDLFHDFMVDCRESKKRYRYDQVRGRWVAAKGKEIFVCTSAEASQEDADLQQRALKFFNLRGKDVDQLTWKGETIALSKLERKPSSGEESFSTVLGPDAKEPGTLTEPREFNLMFKTIVGAMGTEEDAAFLRPETAQGIFANFKNVVDSSRVRVPFGIGQIGKSFRNEITPRNFTFRSREFEQMEIEFFCHPSQSPQWYQYWRDRRFRWYTDLGLAGERLRLRDHDPDELSHYSCGTADIEYAFPFLPAGEFGELEGVAHRGDFDLRSHMEGKLVRQGETLVVEQDAEGKPRHRGSGKDLTYYDDITRERYLPHVIEPSAGADRATLAFLCEAYHEDQAPDEKGEMQTRLVLRLHPRLAPYKAAVFPLVKKDGMPEVAQRIYRDLKPRFTVYYDDKGAVGRRYRRQDEVGTPICITVDGQTLTDGTVTFRDRDTLRQWRVKVDECRAELSKCVEGKAG